MQKYRAGIGRCLAAAAAFAAVWPSAAVADGKAALADRLLCVHGVATGGQLLVRDKPAPDGAVLAEVAADACGFQLAGRCEGDWCEMTRGQTRGWVDTRFIGVYEPASPTPKGAADIAPPSAGIASAGSAGRRAAATRTGGSSNKGGARMAVHKHKPAHQKSAYRKVGPPTRLQAQSHPVTAESSVLRVMVGLRLPFTAGGWRGLWKSPPSSPYASNGRGWGWSSQDGVSQSGGACVVHVAPWDTLRLRTGPGVGHEAIGGIPPGDCRVVSAGGCRGDWCRVAWHGRIGWVNTSYLD
ncbi:MAG: SH3 domain-containing protein [Hyphomicrobiaceae bacterium]